mgnify:CR=1 FL=1
MTRADVEAAVRSVLSDVAPETAAVALRPDVPIRDQVDLDSFDYLNFIIGLHERLGVTVPEADYGQLMTLAGAVDYLMARGARPAGRT